MYLFQRPPNGTFRHFRLQRRKKNEEESPPSLFSIKRSAFCKHCILYTQYNINFNSFAAFSVDKRTPSRGSVLTIEVTEKGATRTAKERMNEKLKKKKKRSKKKNHHHQKKKRLKEEKKQKKAKGNRLNRFFITKQMPKIAILECHLSFSHFLDSTMIFLFFSQTIQI